MIIEYKKNPYIERELNLAPHSFKFSILASPLSNFLVLIIRFIYPDGEWQIKNAGTIPVIH